MVREAVKTGQCLKIVVAAESNKNADTVLEQISCETVKAADSLFAQMTQTENSQGILAVVQKKKLMSPCFGRRSGKSRVT